MAISQSVFLSYSTKDKALGNDLKTHMTPSGYDVFLAHADLTVSKEWSVEIRKKLRSCDVYIALLTEAFRSSEWTDQEAGYALSRGQLTDNRCIIVPVVVPPVKAPHGFLGSFQAVHLDLNNRAATYQHLVRFLDEELGLKAERKDELIDRLFDSSSFQSAKKAFYELLNNKPFSEEQLNRILDVALQNSQIQLPEVVADMETFVSGTSLPTTRKKEFMAKFRVLTH